jgi:LmbE family N-acetylglucosaminyl deacetylase
MKHFILFAFLVLASTFSCKKYKEIELENTDKESSIHHPDPSEKNNNENPFVIWESASQPNNSLAPAIFYAPHQDDETIGMGASIAEHVRLGHPVYIVLLTNGANADMLKYLKNLNPSATMQSVIDARNNEFLAACIALGVSKVYIANYSEGFDESLSKHELENKFENTMHFMAKLYPSASHKTVSGNCDSYNNSCHKMPTHQAATNALHNLYTKGIIKDIRLYRVYIFYNNTNYCDRPSSWVKSLNKNDKIQKQLAINQYKIVDPSLNRYGLAYHLSVQQLLDNSYKSNKEYVDFIENDY